MKRKPRRLTNYQSKELYMILSTHKRFDLLPERWQEIIECLAIGMTFREIALLRTVTMQAIQGQRVKAIQRLGYPLHKGRLTIRALYDQVVMLEKK